MNKLRTTYLNFVYLDPMQFYYFLNAILCTLSKLKRDMKEGEGRQKESQSEDLKKGQNPSSFKSSQTMRNEQSSNQNFSKKKGTNIKH